MSVDYNKCPFPWFGGKSKAAPLVWELLGDVPHYVEPFAGSLAVLLGRPHLANRPYLSETVNDADGLLVNAWRSIQLHPEETAHHASNPVAECDLHARHVALVRWRTERQLEHLMGEPEFCDPKMAGWWLWGLCCWIGSGFSGGQGAWWPDETGRLVKRARGKGGGVGRQLPHVSNNGMGVNHAGTREPGVGDFHPVTMPELLRWFAFLSARLRHVRICNGDWLRVCKPGAAKHLPVRMGKGPAGVFLDPPYADTAKRTSDLYAVDSLAVAHAVRDFCLKHGPDPDYRIVLAGFEGEHGTALEDAGWTALEWYAIGHLTGGYGNGTEAGHQQKRERLWASPHCVKQATPAQVGLFGGTA